MRLIFEKVSQNSTSTRKNFKNGVIVFRSMQRYTNIEINADPLKYIGEICDD